VSAAGPGQPIIMAASPRDVVRSDVPPRRGTRQAAGVLALCDAHPDDGAQAGAGYWPRPITSGRALYDGADGAGVLDDLSEETAEDVGVHRVV
jgi:hypothetical protein